MATTVSLFRLDGSVVLVTGAGSGTGLSIATDSALAGAQLVILVGRTVDTLESAAATIAAMGGRAEVRACDVTDTGAIRELIHSLPRLDVLVNNAGTNIPEPFADVSDEHLDTLIRLNMRASFIVAQAAVKKMRELPRRVDAGGAIVNITSQMGHVGSANRTAYCMTKHGIEGLTKAMAIELAPSNIRVNSIAPTFIDTPLIRKIVDSPATRDQLVSRIPMGRMATVEDISSAAIYLSSSAAAMVSGACLLVDGGWTAQ